MYQMHSPSPNSWPSNSPTRAFLINRSSRSSSSAMRWRSAGVPKPHSDSRRWAMTACSAKAVQSRTVAIERSQSWAEVRHDRSARGPAHATTGQVQIGFWISSEERGPREMIRAAQRAEQAGFPYVQLSDHFHPWIDRQGQSPFVWSVIGGIAATTKLTVGTGVTCPIIRIHPAIVAQAAATSSVMLEGRFFLGLGTGENLNEHVIGRGWPPIEARRDMLEEAIDVLRTLFRGGERSFRGRFFTVEDARLYTLGESPPPIYVAAKGPKAAELAARAGDGLIASAPDNELVARYEKAGGAGKPKYVEVQVCWGREASAAGRLVHQLWPTGALGGQLSQELRRPADFAAA